MTDLIIALDVSSTAEVERMIALLGDTVGFYKIGLELFTAEGPDVVRTVKAHGKRVFLDLKFHDIPRTVERAVKSAAALSVDLMTVHAAGGAAMLRAAADAAATSGATRPRLLAVTMLTSLDQKDLGDIGVSRPLPDQVAAMGRLAVANGIDGIVCSPQETARMRQELGGGALLVTPGVRPAGGAVGDQKRVATPAQAARDGATHLVIGRPVCEAPDPKAAATAIRDEIRTAMHP